MPDAVLSFLVGQPVLDGMLADVIHQLDLAPQLPSDGALAHRLAQTVRTRAWMPRSTSPPNRAGGH